MPHRAWAEAEHILCVRLDGLGDVLMTTPAIGALRRAHPGREIVLLTSTAGSRIARMVPTVDRVLAYDPPWMKSTPPRESPAPELEMVDLLREFGADAAVIFTVYSQNPLPAAMLTYLAGVPLRLAHCHENPYQLLTDWVPDPDPGQDIRHEVRRQLDLVAAVGVPAPDAPLELRVGLGERRRALAVANAAGLHPAAPWLIVHPGATAPSRRYPPERFAAIVRHLAALGWQVVLTGSADERPLAAAVRELAGGEAISLAGELDLPALCGLIAAAPLLLANNTGPVHIAAALSTPVVDIYAQTNPQHTPWMVPNRVVSRDVPCANCLRSVCPEGHHACLREIEPREVLAAALELLAGTGAAIPVLADPSGGGTMRPR